MAIELPRAGAGSVGTGGRTRTTRLPDAGDVPTVRTAGDPGLTVPDTAQFATGLSDIGAGVSEVGGRLAAAEARITTRKEGIARDSDDNDVAAKLDEIFRTIEAGGNAADDAEIDAAIQEASGIIDETLKNHAGGELSLGVLSNQLGIRLNVLTDKLAAENIVVGNAQLTRSIENRTDGIVADMLKDSSISIEDRFAQLDQAITFLGMPPNMADGARDIGREKLGKALIGRAIEQADIDEESGLLLSARSLMENSVLRDAIPSTVRSGFANRIIEFENNLRAVGIEARGEAAALTAVAAQFGLDEDDTRDFVIGAMSGGSATITDKRAALDRLVAKGQIDQDTSDKIASGALRIATTTDQNGDTISVLVDLTQFDGTEAVNPIADANKPTVEDTAGPAVAEGPAEPAEDAAQSEVERSIFSIVAGDVAVTGLGPSVAETLQGFTGQFGVDFASAETLLFRRRLDNAIPVLAAALIPNQRFPQKQVDLILEKTAIETGPGTDRKTLMSSIVALDESLLQQQLQAERDSTDGNLAFKLRQEQESNANGLKNFREILGVPPGVTAADIDALGEPETGGINEFIEGITKTLDGLLDTGEEPSTEEPLTEVPPVAEINKLTEDQVRDLAQQLLLTPDLPITAEQVRAIKKKLGVK